MKVEITIYKFLILISTLLLIQGRLVEGNIYLPLTSNFTIEKFQNKVYNKNYYTIPIQIGTPGEEYDLQLDTSSATSWIPGYRCKNCIMSHRLYDPEDSRTSSPTNNFITIEDEDGDVEGYQTADNIQLGTYKLKQFSFVEVKQVSDNFMDHYQGKLGLGYKNYFIKDDEFNFLEKLSKNKLISKKIFSINTINDKKGMFFIGDIPGKEYNTFCNLTDTDKLDDTYKESWVCEMSHSVPISEKETIETILAKANLNCKDSKKSNNLKLSADFRHRMREEEITITCKTSLEELKSKNMAISFLLQDFAYSIPLENLFEKSQKEERMDMLIKYIDDENAIWTFGYPFFSQFLMIFNMEDKHVGMKKTKKTALPIVDVYGKYVVKEEKVSTAFKVFGYLCLILVVLAIIFFVYHAIRKNNLESKKEFINNHIENQIF